MTHLYDEMMRSVQWPTPEDEQKTATHRINAVPAQHVNVAAPLDITHTGALVAPLDGCVVGGDALAEVEEAAVDVIAVEVEAIAHYALRHRLRRLRREQTESHGLDIGDTRKNRTSDEAYHSLGDHVLEDELALRQEVVREGVVRRDRMVVVAVGVAARLLADIGVGLMKLMVMIMAVVVLARHHLAGKYIALARVRGRMRQHVLRESQELGRRGATGVYAALLQLHIQRRSPPTASAHLGKRRRGRVEA